MEDRQEEDRQGEDYLEGDRQERGLHRSLSRCRCQRCHHSHGEE